MIWYILVFAVLAATMLGVFFAILRRANRREVEAVFRRYNENKDPAIIIEWVREKHSGHRLLTVIEFLYKIEDYELAKTVYQAFPFDAYPDRHLRIYACRVYNHLGEGELACRLAQRLMDSYPADDAALALYVEMNLNFGHVDEAKRRLLPRLEHKYQGTGFKTLHARLLAAEGEFDQAIEIMEDVVKRDYMLHRNTVAPLDKRLIYDQYKTSQAYLYDIKKQAGYTDETEPDDVTENGEQPEDTSPT